MSAERLNSLYAQWKKEAEDSQRNVPPDAVTKEQMRFLVFQWWMKIEQEKNAL
jgi:hypothetical protein